MVQMGIVIGEQKEGCYFKLKMDGAGEDRGYRTGRMVGIYSTPDTDYMTYQLSDAGIRWNDRREASQAALIQAKRKKDVAMLILAEGKNALKEILHNTELTEAEKAYRRSRGTLRIHLSGSQMSVYFVHLELMEAAALEMKLLGDDDTKIILESVFGREQESALIPIDVRKLYGLYKDAGRKTVYVLEQYEEFIDTLLPQHEIIGVPVDGLLDVLQKEE